MVSWCLNEATWWFWMITLKKKRLRLCVAKSIFRISFERTSYKLKKIFHLYGHCFEHRGRVIRSPKLDLWWGIWTAFSLGRGEFKDKSPGTDIKTSIAPIKNCGVKVHFINDHCDTHQDCFNFCFNYNCTNYSQDILRSLNNSLFLNSAKYILLLPRHLAATSQSIGSAKI